MSDCAIIIIVLNGRNICVQENDEKQELMVAIDVEHITGKEAIEFVKAKNV